jgi:hypothetical protein
MKPFTLRPFSVLLGVAIGALSFLALGAQEHRRARFHPPGPRPVDVYQPPFPLRSLEGFPVRSNIADATEADAFTVAPGERLALLGTNGDLGGETSYVVVTRWPLADPPEFVGIGERSVSGVPRAILAPGRYVCASSLAGGTQRRFVDGVIGYRVR